MFDDASLVLAGSDYTAAKKAAILKRTAVYRGVDEVPEFEWAEVRRSNLYRTSSWKDIRTLEELLGSAFIDDLDDAAKKAAKAFDAIVAGGAMSRVPSALEAFEKAMRAAFSKDTEKLVRNAASRLIDKGALVAGLEQGLRDTISKNDVIDGMIKNAKFATNEHFSRAVLPEIYGKLDDLYALNKSPTDTLTMIREMAMDGIDRTSSRLRITANGAASRSYHYGVTKGAWDAGFRNFVFTAINDDRTSDICSEMDGKTFSIAGAVNVVERRAGGEEENLPEVSPWFSAGEIDGRTNDELEAMGCLIPPLHANCRSSITLV